MQSATRGGVQRAHTASGTMLVAQDELKETTAQLLQTVAEKFNQHAMSNAALFLKLDTHRSGDISKIELKRGTWHTPPRALRRTSPLPWRTSTARAQASGNAHENAPQHLQSLRRQRPRP